MFFFQTEIIVILKFSRDRDFERFPRPVVANNIIQTVAEPWRSRTFE